MQISQTNVTPVSNEDLLITKLHTVADVALDQKTKTNFGNTFIGDEFIELTCLVNKTDMIEVEMNRREFGHQIENWRASAL